MNDSDLPDSVTKQLDEKIFGFDYDVIEETVDGENATVKVNITAFPIGEAVIEWFREYISTRLSMAFSGASEEEMNAYLESSFTEKLAALEEKSYESTITLSMYQTNGKWMIDESSLDSKFIDRVSDGLFSSITAMSNAFSE
ncbi:MAG: hypothetical protein IJG64_03070 [Oscillospiraceae bacterium]|nr:hypothetical protein [Oscillospiraceae bacterium]